MKKLIMILMIAIASTSVTFGQKKMSKDAKVEDQIIALEKAGWESWKNKDSSWVKKNAADDILIISSAGVADKAQYITDLPLCDIKSVMLENFKTVMPAKDTVILTYTAMQDGICYGQKIPSQVRAMSYYVKRGGRWLEAMYMETPMAQ